LFNFKPFSEITKESGPVSGNINAHISENEKGMYYVLRDIVGIAE